MTILKSALIAAAVGLMGWGAALAQPQSTMNPSQMNHGQMSSSPMNPGMERRDMGRPDMHPGRPAVVRMSHRQMRWCMSLTHRQAMHYRSCRALMRNHRM